MDLAFITNLVEKHEGRRKTVYHDTVDKPTIGVGWNLEDSDSDVIAGHFGLDLADIKNGTPLTDDQINQVRDYQINECILAARRIFPNFDTMPANPQAVIVDMLFNLGETRFLNFKNTIGFLKAGNWKQAANGLMLSLWFHQVGRRATEDIALLNS